MSPGTDVLRVLHEENNRLKKENLVYRDEIFRLRQAINSLVGLQNKLDQITPATDPYTIISRVLSTALEAVSSQDGSLMLLDEDTRELVFVHVIGSARERLQDYHLPPGEGIAGWVIANRKPRLVPDARNDPHFSPMVDEQTGFQTVSLMCVPLADGFRVLGAIEVVNTTTGKPFKQEDLDILLLVARLSTIAILKGEEPGPGEA